MLRNVNRNSSHFEDRCIVGLKSTLGAVQGLWLGNVALYHRSETQRRHNDQPNWNLSFFLTSCDEDFAMDVKQWSTMQIHFSRYRWALRTVTLWMNRNDYATTNEGLLACKKYFALVLVENIFCISTSLEYSMIKYLTQIWIIHQTVINYRTERVEIHEQNI